MCLGWTKSNVDLLGSLKAKSLNQVITIHPEGDQSEPNVVANPSNSQTISPKTPKVNMVLLDVSSGDHEYLYFPVNPSNTCCGIGPD